mgnify:CR=1 FL=1
MGLGSLLERVSQQGATQVRLGNTSSELIEADKAGLDNARNVLGSFNGHKRAQDPTGAANFAAFDPKFRARLRVLYADEPDRVNYAVGIFVALPALGLLERLGAKDEPIIGPALMNAIAKHAFRHILSNKHLSRAYLDKETLTYFGWRNLHDTSSVSNVVKHNLEGEMDLEAQKRRYVGFANPACK